MIAANLLGAALLGIANLTFVTTLDSGETRPSLRKQTRNAEQGQGASLRAEDTGWSNINQEVDIVIPMVLEHLKELGIEYLKLPVMNESISTGLFGMNYRSGLYLSNGIVYNTAGIQRYGDANMTYEKKSFISRFKLRISTLQFEYDFLLKLIPLEVYGKVIGLLEDTIIYNELAIKASTPALTLRDFRIVKFSNIRVELDQSSNIIRQITGAILSPITNLFKDRITTSIADSLKDQMQTMMDDFNSRDPLELDKFKKKMITALVG